MITDYEGNTVPWRSSVFKRQKTLFVKIADEEGKGSVCIVTRAGSSLKNAQ